MRRASSIVLALSCAGCVCRPCRAPCVVSPAATASASVPAAVAASAPRPPTRSQLAAAFARDPQKYLGQGPDALAALAPDVLRVYDLRAAVAEAPPEIDVYAWPNEPTDPGGETTERRLDADLRRIAAEIRDEVGADAWPEDSTFFAGGDGFLAVLQDPSQFAAFEAALSRHAVEGGTGVRLHVDLLGGVSAPARDLGIDPPAVGRAVDCTAACCPADTVERHRGSALDLDVSRGRTAKASRLTRTAFVADYDVEVDFDTYVTDPVAGSVVSGLSATATLIPSGAPEGAVLSLRLRALAAPFPFEAVYFPSSMGGKVDERAVPVERPRYTRCEFRRTLSATPGRRYFAVLSADLSAVLRVDAGEAMPRPARAAWKRHVANIAGGAPTPAAAGRVDTVEIGVTAPGDEAAAPLGRVSTLVGTKAWFDVAGTTGSQRVVGTPAPGAPKSPKPADEVPDGETVEVLPLAGPGPRRAFDLVFTASRRDTPTRAVEYSTRFGDPAKKKTIALPRTHVTSIPMRLAMSPGESRRVPCEIEGPAGTQTIVLSIRFVEESEAKEPTR